MDILNIIFIDSVLCFCILILLIVGVSRVGSLEVVRCLYWSCELLFESV